jgi:hypothetical protein
MVKDPQLIEEILNQIQVGVQSKLRYISLFTAFSIPDIGGAIDSEDGKATGRKYIEWFDKYVSPKYFAWKKQYLNGEDCYNYRCSVLHQGSTNNIKSRYTNTIFMRTEMKNVAYCGAFTLQSNTVLCVDIDIFCENIVKAGWEWLEIVQETELYKRNSEKLISLLNLVLRG